MKCVVARWFSDGRLCAPLFVSGTLRWFEREMDAQGAYWKEVLPPLPTARWWLRANGVQLRVAFFKDDGECPDPTGKTPDVRVFVDGGFQNIAYTTVTGIMPLYSRGGRLKTAVEVRSEFAHWAQNVKGDQIRKQVAQLVADEDPDTNFPAETALLDEIALNLPDEIQAGVDP